MKTALLSGAALLALVSVTSAAVARDQIQVAGSSTVLPYAKIVAEQFGETFTNFKTPVVESGGSGAGIKEFCKGVGENTIDMVTQKDGKTVGDGTIVVATDGKTRMVKSTMTNAKGAKVTSTLAYDKS